MTLCTVLVSVCAGPDVTVWSRPPHYDPLEKNNQIQFEDLKQAWRSFPLRHARPDGDDVKVARVESINKNGCRLAVGRVHCQGSDTEQMSRMRNTDDWARSELVWLVRFIFLWWAKIQCLEKHCICVQEHGDNVQEWQWPLCFIT